MAEPMVLCPVCRTAVPDRDYYRHAQAHQQRQPAPARIEESDDR